MLAAYAQRGVEVVRLDERSLVLPLDGSPPPASLADVGVVHDRSVKFGSAVHALEVLESLGLRCVNTARCVRLCGDKIRTSVQLARAGLPQPRTRLAFSSKEALQLLEDELGYPAVIKPAVGSWGRLVARLNDRHAAEAVLEDREVLGGWTHRSLYLQAFVRKPGRDVRAFVIGDETVAAVYRESEHWVTNTARGARTSNCPVTRELAELACGAARAVEGDVVAVDLVEDVDGRLLVLEVNHSMEFRNSIEPTGVDLADRIVAHVLDVQRARNEAAPRLAEAAP